MDVLLARKIVFIVALKTKDRDLLRQRFKFVLSRLNMADCTLSHSNNSMDILILSHFVMAINTFFITYYDFAGSGINGGRDTQQIKEKNSTEKTC